MPTTLTNGIQLPDKGSVDWYNSMQSNYNLIDTHLGDTDVHVTAEDKANWDSKQGSLSQAQLDAIAQVATNTDDIATLQSGKADASHTHSSSDITDIGDFATKQYVDNSISGLVDNAPAALDTLNELAAALNDDSNFASTVTNALATKANSADLATVATSGSYTDLSNKPTINDSTITIQKNGSTVDTFTTNGSAKTINIPVPTKTSDLTNDSNFVDTSNSAVASGITSAKVTDYDTHIADTDIHVTTADKTKWNNGVTQAYVLRYSGTAITDNSTIAYSTLDNTDNIKVSDKIIDSDGKIFSIVSVDSDNSTVTVGSALIDLALDANVMHLSGNETVAGIKNFTDYTNIRALNVTNEVASPSSSSSSIMPIITTITYGDSSPSVQARLNLRVTANGDKSLYPHENNQYSFGLTSRRFKEIYAYSYKVTSDINGLNPGALGMPDLSNGLDISGYITLGSSDNTYTPPVDGWICLYGYGNACALRQNNIYISGQYISELGTSNRLTGCCLCVKGGVSVDILLRTVTSLSVAYFYPCLGNV